MLFIWDGFFYNTCEMMKDAKINDRVRVTIFVNMLVLLEVKMYDSAYGWSKQSKKKKMP